MKKGFTLVELLIVVTILVMLMTIIFKLSGVGETTSARTMTITRMQRLENCISGYYAAYGSYPPVRTICKRDIYTASNSSYTQKKGERNENIWNWKDLGEANEKAAARQVIAACLAQPVCARFPYNNALGQDGTVAQISRGLAERAASGKEIYRRFWDPEDKKKRLMAGFDIGINEPGRFNGHESDIEWADLQLFQYGLMSYLTPRYIVMMGSPVELEGDQDTRQLYDRFDQWKVLNDIPTNPLTGKPLSSWEELLDLELWERELIPSQAVCARWMANLEKQCDSNLSTSFFGVNLWNSIGGELSVNNDSIPIHQPYGEGNTQDQYITNYLTIKDYFGFDFFYYSPAPYQSYVVWSSGGDGGVGDRIPRTFPPWVPINSLTAEQQECVGKWIKDDIVHMSN